jgi:hypothetical protein
MSGSHSKFSPSSAARGVLCPASVEINWAAGSRESYASELGTVKHALVDLCVNTKVDADSLLGVEHTFTVEGKPHVLTVDEPVADQIQQCLDWVRESPGEMFAETKVDVTPWCPEPSFGTCDNVVARIGHATVTDYKFGGLKVLAFKNIQLVLYALGWWLEWNWLFSVKTFTLRIAQPTLGHFDVWETTIDELLELGSWIKMRLMLSQDRDPEFAPSDAACKFCAVNLTCKANRARIDAENAYKMDDWREDFIYALEDLSREDLLSAYQTADLLRIRIKAVEEEVERLMRSGVDVGLKLVEGTSHRRWRSVEEARQAMLAAGIPAKATTNQKLITPAQAEKLVKKSQRKILGEAIVKPVGKPTIVPMSDPRPEYGQHRADVFDDESDEAFDVED